MSAPASNATAPSIPGLPAGARLLPPANAAPKTGAAAEPPATTSADAAPPKPAKGQGLGSRSEMMAELNRKIAEQNKANSRSRVGQEEEEETEEEESAETPAAEEPPADEETPAATEEEEPKPAPKTLSAAARATALLKAQRMESELLTHKQAAEKYKGSAEQAEARAKTAEARLEELAGDPVKALKHAKTSAYKIAEMMRDGVISAETDAPEIQLPKAVQERLDRAEKLAAEAEAREAQQAAEKAKADAQAEAERQWNDHVQIVDEVVKSPEFVEAFPLASAYPYASARLLQMINQGIAKTGKEPPISEVASALQADLLKESVSLLKNESAAKALLSDESVAAVFRKLLGASKTPAQRDPAGSPSERTEEGTESADKQPRTITNKAVSRVPSRVKQVLKTSDLTAKINAQLFGK